MINFQPFIDDLDSNTEQVTNPEFLSGINIQEKKTLNGMLEIKMNKIVRNMLMMVAPLERKEEF